MTNVDHHTQLLLGEMRYCQLFAWPGLKMWSSWSLTPEYLGLQVWATGAQQGLTISSQMLSSCFFLIIAILIGVTCYLLWFLICVSLMIYDTGCHTCWPFVWFFLEKNVYSGPLPIVFVFCCCTKYLEIGQFIKKGVLFWLMVLESE
jgi:hypothetical protein